MNKAFKHCKLIWLKEPGYKSHLYYIEQRKTKRRSHDRNIHDKYIASLCKISVYATYMNYTPCKTDKCKICLRLIKKHGLEAKAVQAELTQ